MPRASVDLGSFKVAGKRANLSMTLSASFSINLPSSWPAAPTAEELCHASSAGRLWISKAGSCEIEVLSLVNGEVPDVASFDASIMAAIASFPSECPVWQHIGLELRTNHAFHARRDQSHAQASYFLHHPDLSSEMIAPPDVPSGQFESLRCEINYGFKSAKDQTNSKPRNPKQAASGPRNLAEDVTRAPASHNYRLRSNPKSSRKAAVAQEAINNTCLTSSSSASCSQFESNLDDGEQEDVESLVLEAAAEMACLLDFAFRKLIGVKGVSPGLRTVKSMVSPSLIDIAPAVWDLQYLQTMAAHAKIIPSITAGIVRLRNSKSASLREKLDILARRRTPGDGGQKAVNAEADAADGVKRRLWLLCQTRIRPEPIKGPYTIRKADQSAAQQPSSQPVLSGRELYFFSHHIDDFDSSSLILADHYGLVTDRDQSPALPEVLPEPIHPKSGRSLQSGESCMPENGESSSNEWTHSSEGDYFYTDGQGNIYPIARQGVQEKDQIEWPSTPRLVDSEGFSHEEDEIDVHWERGANQAYIMYHEVQQWPTVPGVHIRLGDAPNQPFPSSYPDDSPFRDWAGD